jgi:hypothetical protein
MCVMTSSGADGSPLPAKESQARLILLGMWIALKLFILLALVSGGTVVIYQNF